MPLPMLNECTYEHKSYKENMVFHESCQLVKLAGDVSVNVLRFSLRIYNFLVGFSLP